MRLSSSSSSMTTTTTTPRWRSRVVVFTLLILMTVFILFSELTVYWDIVGHLRSFFRKKAKTVKTTIRFNEYNTNKLVLNTTSPAISTLLRHEKNEDKYINSFSPSSSIDSWSPFIVNQNCPIFVVESDRKDFSFAYSKFAIAHNLCFHRWPWWIWRSV